MGLLETIGWIGGIALAICGAPQAYKSIKDGHSDGTAWGFLILWFTGELSTLIYILPKGHLPLLFNYMFNIIFLIIIITYKIKPRKPDEGTL